MDETISSLTSAISERSSNSAHTCFDASMYFLPYTPTYSNGTPMAITAEPRLPRSEGCAQRRKQPSTEAKVLGGTRVLTCANAYLLKNFCSDETAERQQPLHAKQHCAAQHRAEQSLSVCPSCSAQV
jgi:hypothetical protein